MRVLALEVEEGVARFWRTCLEEYAKEFIVVADVKRALLYLSTFPPYDMVILSGCLEGDGKDLDVLVGHMNKLPVRPVLAANFEDEWICSAYGLYEGVKCGSAKAFLPQRVLAILAKHYVR